MRRPTPDPTALKPGHRRRRGSRLSALAALTAATLVLAACGGFRRRDDGAQGPDGQSADTVRSTPPTAPRTHSTTPRARPRSPSGTPTTPSRRTTLEEAATAYNASQDRVRVSVEAQGTYPELLKKYEERLSTPQDLPDVIFSEDTTLQFMVDTVRSSRGGGLRRGRSRLREFYDALLEPVRTAYTAQGKLWAAAYGVSMRSCTSTTTTSRRPGWAQRTTPDPR